VYLHTLGHLATEDVCFACSSHDQFLNLACRYCRVVADMYMQEYMQHGKDGCHGSVMPLW
jgi:hypothetical protein